MFSQLNFKLISEISNWADYIVIGAGAAGCILSKRLAEDPKNKVLVIELGPDNLDNIWIKTPGLSQFLWDHPDGPSPSPSSLAFETTYQINRKYRYPRGNGLGGSVNHHTLIDGRGDPRIYDNIAELVGDPRWGSANIWPYFKKMEKYHSDSSNDINKIHGRDGWLEVQPGSIKSPFYTDLIHAAKETLKAPYVGDLSLYPEGVGIVDLQIKTDGTRSASYEALLSNKNNNIIILFNTLVSKIIFTNNTAIGVECIHRQHNYGVDDSLKDIQTDEINTNLQSLKFEIFTNKEIILAGGAINSPQLLLLSGIGPRSHLESFGINVLKDLPGVGSDLMDHHEVAVNFELNSTIFSWPAMSATILDKINLNDIYIPFFNLFADRQEQKTSAGGVIIDWYSGYPTDIGHDLHIHANEGFFFDFDLKSSDPLPDGKLRTDYFRSQYDPNHPEFFRVFQHFLIETLKIGRADGTIRLATTDPTVPPILDLALYTDEDACNRLATGIMMVRQIVKHSNIKKYYKLNEKEEPIEIFPGPQYDTLEKLKSYLKIWSSFGHHISGTAKMGKPTDRSAVVDTNLRVYGFNNLRVADTSIYPFPYLHGFNTARAAYLVGEICADIIKQNAK